MPSTTVKQRALETLRREGPGMFCAKALRRIAPQWTARRVTHRIHKLPDNLPTDRLVDFTMSVGGKLIAPQQVRSELDAFVSKIKNAGPPKVVLEIGTFNGGTLFLLSRLAAPDACIISIDMPGGDFGGGYPAWKTSLFSAFTSRQQKLHLLRADSHQPQTLDQVKAILADRPVDLLFIDGDHTYEGSFQDFEMYSPLVRPGGLIAFHDIVDHGPKARCRVDRTWARVKADFPHDEFIENPKQGWAGIGVVTYKPCKQTSAS